MTKYTTVHFIGSDVVARHQMVDKGAPLHTLLRLLVDRDGAELAWLTDAPCEKAPHGGRVAAADLAASVARGCGNTACVDKVLISAVEDVPFDRVVSALDAASKEGTADFHFALGVGKKPLAETKDVCGERIVAALAPEEIQRIVRADFGALRACYEDALTRDPKAGGRIGLRFVIEGDGRVIEASAQDDSTFRDPQATTCILVRARKLVFPKRVTGGKTTIVYPIIFSPEER